MAVGVVALDAVAEPEHLLGPEGLREHALESRPRAVVPRPVAVRIEQARLGRQDRAGAVAIDPAGFEDEVEGDPGHARDLRHLLGDPLVPVPRRIFPAPGVVEEIEHDPPRAVARLSKTKIPPWSRTQASLVGMPRRWMRERSLIPAPRSFARDMLGERGVRRR